MADVSSRGNGIEVRIRAVSDADHEAIHEILMSPHVLAGTMRVPHSPLGETRERLSPPPGTYHLVAESERRVVGFGELITYPDQPRHRHVGEINMVATHADWLRRGVGRALMEAIIDLAENYLNLRRLFLIVFSENAHTIGFYEGLGFEVEGTMRQFGFGPNGWMDAIMMARLRERPLARSIGSV